MGAAGSREVCWRWEICISACLYIDGNDPIESKRLPERTERFSGMLSPVHKWMDWLIWKQRVYGKRRKDQVCGCRHYGNSLVIILFL